MLTFAGAVRDGVTACGKQQSRAHVLKVAYAVDGATGGIMEVAVEPDERKLLECVARVLLSMCYEPCRTADFKVKFPFRL